jgi:hypothetical protein
VFLLPIIVLIIEIKKKEIIISQNKDIRPLFFFGLNQQGNVMGAI